MSYQSIQKYPSVWSNGTSEVTNMRVESICDDNFGFLMDGLCQFTWLLAHELYFWIHFCRRINVNSCNMGTFDDNDIGEEDVTALQWLTVEGSNPAV